MSGPNKSLDKNKRYAGVKANDFVNKTRANEANRSAVRPQGWANLGKINSRRVPPPANLPSLKSETSVSSPQFDPPTTTNHGWTSNDNQTPIHSIPNPTQQQIDSLPVNSPTPPLQQSSADIDKSRVPPSWSTITAGTNPNDQTPNLLAFNDFPRLATTQDRKSQQTEPITNIQNSNFRPSNIAIWKGGGGTRIQSIPNDFLQTMPHNHGANMYPPQMPNTNMRMYPPQMWAYNPYTSVPLSMHQQQQQQQHVNTLNEYKSPTILRNKDIDDLSKITDNTWANASQEVNYEEKIRFSDDEDILDTNTKPHRLNSQVSQHTRLIQDDQHLKKMQDNKNSELINALTIAKQRRDEQERHLRNEQNFDENKQIPGYQTRPLLASNDQENLNWKSNKDTSRTRHDTANSQSSFTMKSWSDQMDSFNYSSLHEKSGGHVENDGSYGLNKNSRSPSETSLHSQPKNDSASRKSKKFPLSSKKQPKTRLMQTKNGTKKPPQKFNNNNQQMNSNNQWDNWEESVDNRQQQYTNDNNRHRQQLHSDDQTIQKPNRFNKQPLNKTRDNDRQQNSRSKPTPLSSSISSTNKTNQSNINNKNQQPVWRPLSPTRQIESIDPTPHESISYKTQQRNNLNDHKQRYQTIDTSSIPPLMSVRSDATTTAKLYQSINHTGSAHYDDDYYDDENAYYDSNLQTHQRYHHSNLHNRGYTALGSYGRYRRGGTLRHQQQYTSYNVNNTSGISSAPTTSSGTRQKKNSTNRPNTNNKKSNQSSEQIKTPVIDEGNSSLVKKQIPTEEVPLIKPTETSISSPTTENLPKDNGKVVENVEKKTLTKNENETTNAGQQVENESMKTNKKTSENTKRRTNKDQQNYYQNQQAPRHRNNYSRSMQDYDPMQMAGTHNYYGTTHRTSHSGRNPHMHDLSGGGYYYEHPQQHYNNRYNYSNEHYQQQQRSTNKNSKRGGGVGGGGSTTNNNLSDNDQKEGEEWETASESSTNMRNGHHDNSGINNQQTNETKSINRGRTPPKKSFSNQRPNTRHIIKFANA